jgi:hypothetical protein
MVECAPTCVVVCSFILTSGHLVEMKVGILIFNGRTQLSGFPSSPPGGSVIVKNYDDGHQGELTA